MQADPPKRVKNEPEKKCSHQSQNNRQRLKTDLSEQSLPRGARQLVPHEKTVEDCLDILPTICLFLKNLFMGLFLMGCFPGDFHEGNGLLRQSGKRPVKVGKRPIQEGKRPIKANGVCSGTLPWWKMAPRKRPIKRSMMFALRESCQKSVENSGSVPHAENRREKQIQNRRKIKGQRE